IVDCWKVYLKKLEEDNRLNILPNTFQFGRYTNYKTEVLKISAICGFKNSFIYYIPYIGHQLYDEIYSFLDDVDTSTLINMIDLNVLNSSYRRRFCGHIIIFEIYIRMIMKRPSGLE